MNLSSIINLLATVAFFGVSNAALHGNPVELPFGLELDMDRNEVVEHFENNTEFVNVTTLSDYSSLRLRYKTTQEFNGVRFVNFNVFFLSGPDVGGIFRVDLNSNKNYNGQAAFERLIELGRYFQQEGLQSAINRFGELETFEDLANRIVLVYSEEPTTIHINSLIRDLRKSVYITQVSWLNTKALKKIEEEFQSSPTALLKTYYSLLERELYFVAELLCTRAGRLELDNWKQLVSDRPELRDMVYEFQVGKVTIHESTATATVATPTSPFSATLAKVNGLWKVYSSLGFD